jgi:hypothetical protein
VGRFDPDERLGGDVADPAPPGFGHQPGLAEHALVAEHLDRLPHRVELEVAPIPVPDERREQRFQR